MTATRILSPALYPAAAVALSLAGCGLMAAAAVAARLCGLGL